MSAARHLDRVFDGTASQLVLSLLRAEKIPPDELEVMRTLIRKAVRSACGGQAASAFTPPRRSAGVGATRSDPIRRVTMLLRPHSLSLLWAGVVATAVIALAVLASGVGLTADEPKEKAKPLDPQALRRKLADLMRNGNPDPAELRRLMEEMNGPMMEQMKQRLGRGGFEFRGVPDGAFNPAAPAKAALREEYEKRLKQFDEEVAKNAADADAQAALRKARDAYVEAMADELKKADEAARKNPLAVPGVPFPDFPDLQFGGDIERIPFPAFPAFPGMDDPFAGRGGGLRARPTRLGIQIEMPTPALVEQLDLPADVGVVVAAVVAGSPAEKAGLKKNDVLVKLAGKDAPSDPTAFTELVAKLKAGEKFDLDLIRKGKKETVKGVELPQPKKPAAGGLGGLGGGNGFNQMRVQVNNGDVTIRATADGVTFDIGGAVEDGKVVPAKIGIDDGEKRDYPSLDKVPEKHRPAVEKLLGQVRAFGGR